MALTLRSTKGIALTWAEMDANFSGLADGSLISAATWTTPTFSAGDFTASGSMTWTVDAGDVVTYAYTIINKVMTVLFYIDPTTVGGTPSTSLQIAIPANKTATKAVF